MTTAAALFWAASAGHGQAPPATADANTTGAPTLVSRIEAYMRADSARDRRQALADIRAQPKATFAAVAEALAQVQLWEPRAPGLESIELRLPRPGKRLPHLVSVPVRVPAGYDPGRAFPLLLGFPNRDTDPAQFAAFLATMLGTRADEFLIAVPSRLEGVWLTDPQAAAGDPLALLELLRRRYHVETNRVLLTGYGQGGHAAFTLAVLCPDPFAAALPLAGTCALDLGADAVDVFLPNIAGLPVWAVHGARDVEGVDSASGAATIGGVAAWNRYLADRAQRLGVPLHVTELPDAGSNGVAPGAAVLAAFLDACRPSAPRELSLRFRYPEQGRIGWLRQTRFSGEPWTAQQIVVSPASDETPEAAVRAVLTEKLAYLAGVVEGQAIRIETHRCERIEILLSDALLNLDEEITVHANGTERFRGKVERSLETLLEEARTHWDFSRPVAARLQIGKASRAIPR